jgi:hypothetical protein
MPTGVGLSEQGVGESLRIRTRRPPAGTRFPAEPASPSRLPRSPARLQCSPGHADATPSPYSSPKRGVIQPRCRCTRSGATAPLSQTIHPAAITRRGSALYRFASQRESRRAVGLSQSAGCRGEISAARQTARGCADERGFRPVRTTQGVPIGSDDVRRIVLAAMDGRSGARLPPGCGRRRHRPRLQRRVGGCRGCGKDLCLRRQPRPRCHPSALWRRRWLSLRAWFRR